MQPEYSFLGTFEKFRKATISCDMSILSVCLFVWKNAAPTGRIFIKFHIWLFFEDLLGKLKLHKIWQK